MKNMDEDYTVQNIPVEDIAQCKNTPDEDCTVQEYPG